MTDSLQNEIGLLTTKPIQDHSAAGAPVGQFELPITVDLRLMKDSGDAVGFIKHAIAMHLSSAIYDTEVPAEYWRAQLDPKFAREFNLPAFFTFEV